MPRRYRRRRTYALSKRVRYSNETYAAGAVVQWAKANLYKSTLIAGTNVLGTRKCKNFTLTLCLKSTADSPDFTIPMYFALVFVPEGTEASAPHVGGTIENNILQATSFYEPNQNVIFQGLVDHNQVYKFKTRLARNLNAGDTIQLIWSPYADFVAESLLTFTLNYALAF